ncbi:MAG: TolC family protein [Acidobacteria bacterium]|nr:TolC family protein [Acidobacteriota bacterium]
MLCLTVAALAQAPVENVFFPKAAYFRQTFSNPSPRVEMKPPVRLSDFVHDSRMELSLRSYLELVLANNTDVQITRLNVEFQKNAIQRAFGRFDPLGLASFTSSRQKSPTNDVLQGAATLSQLTQPYNFQYRQTMETGTAFNVSFAGSKVSSNSQFVTFNPSITSNLQIGFTQPLLRDRGAFVNRIPISIARSSLRVSEYTLRDRLMTLLSDAELDYWNLVQARENLRVQEESQKLYQAALKRAERELELGALSRLDIYQPQAQYASAEIGVSQALFRVSQSEDRLRKQIGADLDPTYRKASIIPTETVLPPADSGTVDAEMAVERALAYRPDLKAAIQRLDVDDLSIKSATNQLRPAFNLTGNYTSQGRGGNFFQRTNVFNDVGGRATIVSQIPGGIGDALDQLFGFGFPIYSFGFQLTLPVRNRAAAADMADALIRKKQDTLSVRSLEQQVRLDVMNAVSQVESSKASVRLATVFRDLALKQLEAEQKKYELGTSQLFFLLQFGQNLVQAESQLVAESVNYRRNLLNLLRRTGELLDERGVVVQ